MTPAEMREALNKARAAEPVDQLRDLPELPALLEIVEHYLGVIDERSEPEPESDFFRPTPFVVPVDHIVDVPLDDERTSLFMCLSMHVGNGSYGKGADTVTFDVASSIPGGSLIFSLTDKDSPDGERFIVHMTDVLHAVINAHKARKAVAC